MLAISIIKRIWTFDFYKRNTRGETGGLFVFTEGKSIVEALRYLPGMLTGM